MHYLMYDLLLGVNMFWIVLKRLLSVMINKMYKKCELYCVLEIEKEDEFRYFVRAFFLRAMEVYIEFI